MNIREYTEKDFLIVEKWWREHHGNDFRPSYPPRESFIVEDNGNLCGFFGIAPMTPAFCYFAFPLVNPHATNRNDTVDFMVESAKIIAQHAGYSILWISIRGEKMISRLLKSGFIEAERGNSHMFYKLGEIE